MHGIQNLTESPNFVVYSLNVGVLPYLKIQMQFSSQSMLSTVAVGMLLRALTFACHPSKNLWSTLNKRKLRRRHHRWRISCLVG